MPDTIKSLSEKHDALKPRRYTEIYDDFYSGLRNVSLNILELGNLKGGSLKLWAEYFPNSQIVGIDINQVDIQDHAGRIHLYQGCQQDKSFLDCVSNEVALGGFYIIIDDASHVGLYTKESF